VESQQPPHPHGHGHLTPSPSAAPPERNLRETFLYALVPTIVLLGLMAALHVMRVFTGWELYFLGLLPRHFSGLPGVFTAPFIHGDFAHLFSNISALAAALMFLFMVYPHAAWRVVLGASAGTNVLVWLLAREDYHIGASGMVYGVLFFLLFSGIFRRDGGSIAVAFLALFMNQGLIWGVLPLDPQVSWESHLYGAVMGIFMAYALRNVDRKPRKKQDQGPDHDHDAWDYRKQVRM